MRVPVVYMYQTIPNHEGHEGHEVISLPIDHLHESPCMYSTLCLWAQFIIIKPTHEPPYGSNTWLVVVGRTRAEQVK